MTKEIIKLYEDFFNTIEKDKISYIYKAYPKVDEVFNNIINNLEYYYNNSSELLLKKPKLTNYFENDKILNNIMTRVKYMINYINIIFYDICNYDLIRFDSYFNLIYNLFILEEIYDGCNSENIAINEIEEDIKTINELIYNNSEISKELNDYYDAATDNYSKNLKGYIPIYMMFEMLNEMLFEKTISSETLNDYLNGLKYEFLNNLESFEELINQIKIYDIYLYNKILKAENVILKLFQAWKENIKLFDNNNKRIISSLLIELTNMYNVYMCELDRVMDLYGIEYVVKYKDLIYFSSLINDTLDLIEDITPDDLDYANTFLDMYESILNLNMDDFEQFVDNGEDVLKYLRETYDIILIKFEEIVEDLYNKFIKNQNLH